MDIVYRIIIIGFTFGIIGLITKIIDNKIKPKNNEYEEKLRYNKMKFDISLITSLVVAGLVVLFNKMMLVNYGFLTKLGIYLCGAGVGWAINKIYDKICGG